MLLKVRTKQTEALESSMNLVYCTFDEPVQQQQLNLLMNTHQLSLGV